MIINKKLKEIILNLVNSGANLKKIKATLIKIFCLTDSSIPKDNVFSHFHIFFCEPKKLYLLKH